MSVRMRRISLAALLLVLAGALWFVAQREGSSRSMTNGDPFAHEAVLHLRLEIPPDALESLRQDARKDVTVVLWEGDRAYRKVEAHLKGATGSFRPVDGKPAITLKFAGPHFYGLRKIHLNNSVEDPAYVNEALGGELFRSVGIPAPRTAHALVEMNGRKLGVYVVKEGFNEDFLARHFKNGRGNFYEPVDGHDIDRELMLQSGPGPATQDDRRALDAAIQETDPTVRLQKLGGLLDLDQFITFMALEVMIGHRDGYSLARNNYRLYHDPGSGRMVFLPHGMDQLFGKEDYPWLPRMSGLVARAVMETPVGQQKYRERFEELFTRLYDAKRLGKRVRQLAAPLRAELPAAERRELDEKLSDTIRRIELRQAWLQRRQR
jgi:hypothetical protein